MHVPCAAESKSFMPRQSERKTKGVPPARFPAMEMPDRKEVITEEESGEEFVETEAEDWKAKYMEAIMEVQRLKALKTRMSDVTDKQERGSAAPPPPRQPIPDALPGTSRTYNNNPNPYFSHATAKPQPLSVLYSRNDPPVIDVWANSATLNNRPRPHVHHEDHSGTPSPSHWALVDLPVFDGSPDKWAEFIVSYRETSRHYSYTNLVNHSRLHKALKGKARETAGALLIHPNNVEKVIERLHFRYGRPELLVRSHMDSINRHPNVTRMADVVGYSETISNVIAHVKASGAPERLNDYCLLDLMVSKLPAAMRTNWIRFCYANFDSSSGSVLEFSAWLDEEAKYILLGQDAGPSTAQSPRGVHAVEMETIEAEARPASGQRSAITEQRPATGSRPPRTRPNAEARSVSSCFVCGKDHKVTDCGQFNQMSPVDRWALVKEVKCCFSCLRQGHNVSNCHRRQSCGINGCGKRHSPLLHDGNLMTTTTTTIGNNFVRIQDKSYYKYVPLRVVGPNGQVDTIAFIDEGSKATLIEQELADQLGLKGAVNTITLKWMNGSCVEYPSRRVHTELQSLTDGCCFVAKNLMTIPALDLPEQDLDVDDLKRSFPTVNDLPLVGYGPMKPRLLIGLPHLDLICPLSTVSLTSNFAVQKMKIGWAAYGGKNDEDCFVASIEMAVDDLDSVAREYFNLDSLLSAATAPLKRNHSAADTRAISILNRTTRKIQGGYETGLLWKCDSPSLPQSYGSAYKRLRVAEEKMGKDEAFGTWYKDKIAEYLQKGYAVKIPKDRVNKPIGPVWYLPHFVVTNKNKRRLVFDAAAKANGTSLNDYILKGPIDYEPKPLLTILLHFRQEKIGICGDIKEMFNRVTIRDEDQDAQRFLWRDGDTSRPVDVYVMKAMTFGSRSSPCSAQFVKNSHANQFRDSHPRAVEAIQEYHYVDDYVDCFKSEEEAMRITKDVIQIHHQAGFQLRGFVSNNGRLLKELNSAHAELELGDASVAKVLGLWWEPKTDEFRFRLDCKNIPANVADGITSPTKAQTLSAIMSVFDPFGFLADVMVISKLLMRDLWTTDVQWKDEITMEHATAFRKWMAALKEAESLRFPRCHDALLTHENTIVELHIFVDASQDALAAVGYFRIKVGAMVSVSFIAGKCRCVPRISPTIPRLELQSALLGTKLMTMIRDAHNFAPSRTVMWSDSKTTLCWIKDTIKTPDKYINGRVYNILLETNREQWRWVPGPDNPADIATRAVAVGHKSKMWITGPEFLKLEEDSWPTLNTMQIPLCAAIEFKFQPLPIDFLRYSSYSKCRRILAWVFRAMNIFKSSVTAGAKTRSKSRSAKANVGHLSLDEINAAELIILKSTQQGHFRSDMETLLAGGNVTSQSDLFCLSPVLADDGLLRVGSRTGNCQWIPWAARWPIILPKFAHITYLIVDHFHRELKHQNVNSVIAAIRTKFWIPCIRQVVRRIIGKCQVCKNRRARPKHPFMGNLPVDRLEPYIRPFSYVGLDYAGPFHVAIGRRREKRWIALFTCLTVRAVHMEVAKDLSSDATILCLSNFIHRRGVPVRIRSDRGTNFVGAKSEGFHLLCAKYANQGIEWVLNVPGNPEAGGCWERLIQSVKRVFEITLKEKAPQLEIFIGHVIEAENIVNSRPLTDIPIESEEADPLTPNHFLIGSPSQSPTPLTEGKVVKLDRMWATKLEMGRSFWKRWIQEYLPTLTRRTKHCERTQNIAVGDVVVICDPAMAKGAWLKGRVTAVVAGPDLHVRSAFVKTVNGELHRPVSKLAILDVQPREPPRMS